jgi:hypothetical protein
LISKNHQKRNQKISRGRETDTKSMKNDTFYEVSFAFLNSISSTLTSHHYLWPRNTKTPLIHTIIKVRSPASGPGDGRSTCVHLRTRASYSSICLTIYLSIYSKSFIIPLRRPSAVLHYRLLLLLTIQFLCLGHQGHQNMCATSNVKQCSCSVLLLIV